MTRLATALLALALAGTASAEELDLAQGAIQLGGTGTIEVFAGEGDTQLVVSLQPAAGYFVADNVEVFGAVGLVATEGATAAGISVGARYFFPASGVHPYLGGQVGYGQTAVVGLVTADAVTLGALGGILIPMNAHVGIDIGARLNLLFVDNATFVHVPVGYFGVQAFFR